jgi:arylsulfatase A
MKNMLTVRIALLVVALFALQSRSFATAPKPPNVIFILADDLGIGNLSCYGSDHYKTPNIDKIASTGTTYTRAFTASLCGPSRALIMSGRYAFRNGSTNQDACIRMAPSEMVLPKLFKSVGYATSAIGKWGQLPGLPADHGFDEYLRFNGSGVYWNTQKGKPEAYQINGDDLKLADGQYMPDVMQEQAIGFIRRNQDKPFFLYYSLSHVHGEIRPTPDSAPESKTLFADNILYMDKLVGNIVDELDSLKLRDDTLLIFIGDNGTAKGQAALSTIGGRGLSGMKGSMLECGGLVPLVVSWPGQTPAGKVSDDLIDSTDFVTTFADLTGAELPEKTKFDGVSFASQLRGAAGKSRDWVFNQLASMWYVRDANWKLNQDGELFDMSDAPFAEILVPEEKETSAATAARKRLAAVLAELNPAGGILDTGDGSGRHASKAAKKTNDASAHPNPKPAATKDDPSDTNPEAAERAARFDKLDKQKTGRLTREYYTTHQSDAAAAGERFDKWDTNRDGFLTRDEYIARGMTITK